MTSKTRATQATAVRDLLIDQQIVDAEAGVLTIIEITKYGEDSFDVTFAETRDFGAADYNGDDVVDAVV